MISRHSLASRACLKPRALRSFAHEVRVIARAPPQAAIPQEPNPFPNALDSHVLDVINARGPNPLPSLTHLLSQYAARSRAVLDATLPYEPTPPPPRRVSFHSDDSGVLLLTHAVHAGHEHKISFCSAFALRADHDHGASLIVSCAHTLEEMRRSQLIKSGSIGRSGTIAFHRRGGGSRVTPQPASEVLASLPRSDLVLFSIQQPMLPTLPVSPYPASVGTRIRAHFVSETKPSDPGWTPWIHGTWSKWVQGEVLGYRDFSGREAEPGTYDSLSHLLFYPPPSPGSSGGPIVDEDTGSVVGVMLGSRMDNRVEGVRGWGVPSEVIYEMFKLPGLSLPA